MFSLQQIQDKILTYVATLTPWDVEERAVPDIKDVPVTKNGSWASFVTVQFGMIQQGRGRSMVGPRGHDYNLPVHIQVTSETMAEARLIANRIIDGFLGASFDWAGNVQTRVGGSIFPMKNSDGAVEAYMAPLGFGIPVQLATLPDTP